MIENKNTLYENEVYYFKESFSCRNFVIIYPIQLPYPLLCLNILFNLKHQFIMKTTCILILLLMLFPACQPQENKPDISKEKEAIHQVMSDFFKALETRDWELLKSTSTTDAILVENGLHWTNDSLIYAMDNQWANDKVKYSFNLIKTEVNGSMAWMYYENNAIVSSPDTTFPLNWRENLIFHKINGDWKLVFGHSTPIPKKKQ